MNIPNEQSRRVFTLALTAAYDENISVPTFLNGTFFPRRNYSTKGVGWLARRGKERVAVDVLRGSKGHLNQGQKFTEKMIVPPYYHEKVLLESTSIYDLPFEAGDNYNTAQIQALAQHSAHELDENGKMIERAIELQAAQLLQTGIVELKSGESIDFKRKPEMIEANESWTTTSDLVGYFEGVGRKLRSVGKVLGGQRIATIMGFEAWAIFRQNETIKDAENFFTINNTEVSEMMKNTAGGSYKGELRCGGQTFEIWVYDEIYEDADGNDQYYWDSKTVCCLPITQFIGETSFCGVPQLPNWVRQSPRAASILSGRGNNAGFVLSDYIDEEEEAWYGRIKACPIVQAKSIDMIYTDKVLA